MCTFPPHVDTVKLWAGCCMCVCVVTMKPRKIRCHACVVLVLSDIAETVCMLMLWVNSQLLSSQKLESHPGLVRHAANYAFHAETRSTAAHNHGFTTRCLKPPPPIFITRKNVPRSLQNHGSNKIFKFYSGTTLLTGTGTHGALVLWTHVCIAPVDPLLHT